MLQGPGTLVQSVPVSHCAGAGQVGGIVHEPAPVQKVSHWQASRQSMPPPHEVPPPHSTRQRPAPQSIRPAHELVCVHSMTQLEAALQSIPPAQEESPVHSTLQGRPAGQTTSAGQDPAAEQLMTQKPNASQLVHEGGQNMASGGRASGAKGSASAGGGASAVGTASGVPASPLARMHHPSTQVRPGPQSVGTVQAKSPERSWNVQPVARTRTARPRRAGVKAS